MLLLSFKEVRPLSKASVFSLCSAICLLTRMSCLYSFLNHFLSIWGIWRGVIYVLKAPKARDGAIAQPPPPQKVISFSLGISLKLLVLGIPRSQIILCPVGIRNELRARAMRVGQLVVFLGTLGERKEEIWLSKTCLMPASTQASLPITQVWLPLRSLGSDVFSLSEHQRAAGLGQ